jgi:hypothetical protein
MKAIMGKPTQAAITGGQAPPAIMGKAPQAAMTGGQPPPAIMDPYPGTRGNAYANIVPTIQPSTGSPPPPPPPNEASNLTKINTLLSIISTSIYNSVQKINDVDNNNKGLLFYLENKDFFNSLSDLQINNFITVYVSQKVPNLKNPQNVQLGFRDKFDNYKRNDRFIKL